MLIESTEMSPKEQFALKSAQAIDMSKFIFADDYPEIVSPGINSVETLSRDSPTKPREFRLGVSPTKLGRLITEPDEARSQQSPIPHKSVQLLKPNKTIDQRKKKNAKQEQVELETKGIKIKELTPNKHLIEMANDFSKFYKEREAKVPKGALTKAKSAVKIVGKSFHPTIAYRPMAKRATLAQSKGYKEAAEGKNKQVLKELGW